MSSILDSSSDQSIRTPFTLRPGQPADGATLVALFDEAIAWMTQHDLTDQWGTEPFSNSPKRVATCETWARSGGLTIAERHGVAVAGMVLGEAMPYVPPATEPEVYVQVLIGSRRPESRGAGTVLLTHAERVACERGVNLLRVDCFAGNDGRLVDYYVRCGFTPTEAFTVDRSGTQWPGQILIKRLDNA